MNEKIAEGEDAGLKCRQIHTREHTRKTWWRRGQAHRFEQFNDLLRSAALPDNRQTHAAEGMCAGSVRGVKDENLSPNSEPLRRQAAQQYTPAATTTPSLVKSKALDPLAVRRHQRQHQRHQRRAPQFGCRRLVLARRAP